MALKAEMGIKYLRTLRFNIIQTTGIAVSNAEALRLWCQMNNEDNQEKAKELMLTLNGVCNDVRDFVETLVKDLEKQHDTGN